MTAVSVTGSTAAPAPATAMTPCPSTLNVVAHQDDDLLFINPDISDDITAGKCVTTVFVTAGDAKRGSRYWRSRELGAMAAYARMAGVDERWTEDTEIINRRSVHRATLAGSPITLLFLRLPDRVGGWPLQTVQQLWLNPSASVKALDTRQAYSHTVLLNLLTEVMTAYQPATVRTLDFHGTYGDGDHDDHHAAAYFAYAAQQRYTTEHTVTGYLGYGVTEHPDNLTAGQHDAKMDAFLAYAAYDFHVCDTAEKCDAGIYSSYFRHSVPVAAPEGPGRNVAGWAAPAASSQDTKTAQTASKVADGRLDATRIGEWATKGGRAGSWVTLTWPGTQRLGQVTLQDRLNPRDQVLAGTLSFSDGTSIKVGPLPNDGAPLTVDFSARDVTSVRFTITKVSARTRNTGLAELKAITVS
ncbi:PIG-L family deacetylase [Actinoplanes sp. GCM10030250]|uniref:DUF7402 domain-containing protein n=1 Tax=Actinoplanes sp. GCM10030250 TaxID=3273376 RepID=UPI00361D35AA